MHQRHNKYDAKVFSSAWYVMGGNVSVVPIAPICAVTLIVVVIYDCII